MKRFLGSVALMIAMLCPSAYAQVTVSTSVEFKLQNVNSGLVLGLSGASQTAATKAVQWADNGASDHLWHFMPMGSGEYNIENMVTHQVLGVSNASTANGAPIVQYSDNGTADHLWKITQASDGNYLIQNVNSGRYLEVYQAGVVDTSTIDQWSLTGCTCQEWKLVNTGTSPYVYPGAVSGNGIYVHDPNLLKTSSGVYWLYGTHNTLATSTDRTVFTSDGSALSPIPSWVAGNGFSTSDDLWAPSVIYNSSTSYSGQPYFQYYSASSFGSNWSAIGLATASTPNSTAWTDRGIVVHSGTPPSGYSQPSGSVVQYAVYDSATNAIDPQPVQDASGNWWMSFGSWADGIHLIALNGSTGMPASTSTKVYNLAQRGSPSVGEEGSAIYYHGGYFYYFASINACCAGTSSTYRIIVGRSTTISGPYYDRGGVNLTSGGGTILLSTHGNIVGPGGQSVFTDGSNTVIDYHYYDGNNNGTPTLGINYLGWTSDGWPYVM